MQRLVLLDIDGTLLSSNGAAPSAFRSALEEVFGTSGPRNGYSFAGRTDPQIARDLLRMGGVPAERVERDLPEAWRRYVLALERELRETRVSVLPGAHALVDRLESRADTVLGLLTGNLREGARLKLASAGMDIDRFVVGAFGSDHGDRRELPAVAIRRAEERLGHRFQGKAVVIIGDTPYDVACGAHLDVRTIAVATGSYSVEDLAECGPDHLFDSLAETDAVLRAILH